MSAEEEKLGPRNGGRGDVDAGSGDEILHHARECETSAENGKIKKEERSVEG